MLAINTLISWEIESKDPVIYRVIWIEKKSDIVYLINVESNRFPTRYSLEELNIALQNQNAHIEKTDKYINICDEDFLSDKDIRYRDKAWEVIKDIISCEPYIFETTTRRKLILNTSNKLRISESTIKNYLKRYWIRGMTKNALLPDFYKSGGRGKEKKVGDTKRGRPRKDIEVLGTGINVDEETKKIFKSAINRFYNTEAHNSLVMAYQLMLRDFFRDPKSQSEIINSERLPSFGQFRYWFNKQRNLKKEITKRYSSKTYEQKNRAVLGSSTAEAFGPGSIYQIDATVADVYVVSEFNRSWIIGRPILYMVLDVFSRMVTGFYIGLEGPSYIGAAMALADVAEDKVKLCKQYGIDIVKEQWPVENLPDAIIADRGELEGKDIENLVNTLGITIKNTPPFRADWKGCVESNFRLLNIRIKPFLPGKVDGTFKERGEKDYRLDAQLTLKEFTAIIIKTILYHNNHHVLKNYNRNEYAIEDDVKTIPLELWNWGIENCTGRLKKIPEEIVKLNLMPSDYATVTSRGIKHKGLYYASEKTMKEAWYEKARNNGTWKIRIAYDLRNIDYIYIKDDNGRDFDKCFLLEHQNRYKGECFEDVQYLLEKEKLDIDALGEQEMNAKIELMSEIENIANKAREESAYTYDRDSNSQKLKGISDNRQVEKEIRRIDEAFELRKETENITELPKNKDIFNEHIKGELALFRKKQKEALEDQNE